jgi:hypothetical protein
MIKSGSVWWLGVRLVFSGIYNSDTDKLDIREGWYRVIVCRIMESRKSTRVTVCQTIAPCMYLTHCPREIA